MSLFWNLFQSPILRWNLLILPKRPIQTAQRGLSQWYLAEFKLNDQRYAHAEQYIMAEKARLFDDQATRHAILQTALNSSLGVEASPDRIWALVWLPEISALTTRYAGMALICWD